MSSHFTSSTMSTKSQVPQTGSNPFRSQRSVSKSGQQYTQTNQLSISRSGSSMTSSPNPEESAAVNNTESQFQDIQPKDCILDSRTISSLPDTFSSVSCQNMFPLSSVDFSTMDIPYTSSPLDSPPLTDRLTYSPEFGAANSGSFEFGTASPLMQEPVFDPSLNFVNDICTSDSGLFPYAYSNPSSPHTSPLDKSAMIDMWNYVPSSDGLLTPTITGAEFTSLPSPPLSPPTPQFTSAADSAFPDMIAPLSPMDLSCGSSSTYDDEALFNVSGYPSSEVSLGEPLCLTTAMPSCLEHTPEMPSVTQTSVNKPILASNISHSAQTVHGSSDVSPNASSAVRADPLYKATPRADGFYHCPFEGNEDCNHQPAKLKCTYDKFVDSHLRPYRCNKNQCKDLQFSSTACLLRHEREAHGMHGHGEKPYLCLFPDCDRALPENGFPRRWNLKDHMRRVHNYEDKENNTSLGGRNGSRGSKAASQSKKTRVGRVQKPTTKRARGSGASGSGSHSIVTLTKPVSPASRPIHNQNMHREWLKYRDLVNENLLNLENPNDWSAHEQLIADMNVLHSIGVHCRRSESGQE